MSEHRAHRASRPVRRRRARRRLNSLRVRAILSLGVVFALGAVGTSAFWTDTATITGTTIQSGSMDLQVATSTAGTWNAVGNGTPWPGGAYLNVSNLTPSESYAFNMGVRNVGNADFTYGVTVTQGTTPAWGFTTGAITVEFFSGGTPSVDTSYPIQQTCSGGTSLGTAVAVGTGNSYVVQPTRRLDKGLSESLCLKITMATGANNANQSMSGALRFDLSANQVVTP